MADLQNEFPSWGESGEYPADGFFYEGGDQVNEKHLDALWNGVEVHVGILNEAIRDRVRNLHDNVVLDQGLVASAGGGTREVDVSASNDGAYVDGERTGSINATTTSHTANGGTSTRTDIVYVDKSGTVQKSEGTTTVPNNELKIAEVDVATDDTISAIRNYARDHSHHVASERPPSGAEPGDIWHDLDSSLLQARVAGAYRHVAVENNTGPDFQFEGGITLNGNIDLSGNALTDSTQDYLNLTGEDVRMGTGQVIEDGSGNARFGIESTRSIIRDGGSGLIKLSLGGTSGPDLVVDSSKVSIENTDLRLNTGQSIEDGGGTERLSLDSNTTEIKSSDGFTSFTSVDTRTTIRANSTHPATLYDDDGAFTAVQYNASSTSPGTLELTNADMDMSGNSISNASSLEVESADGIAKVNYNNTNNTDTASVRFDSDWPRLQTTVNGTKYLNIESRYVELPNNNLRLATDQVIEDGSGNSRFGLYTNYTGVFSPNQTKGLDISDTSADLEAHSSYPARIYDHVQAAAGVQYDTDTGAGVLRTPNAGIRVESDPTSFDSGLNLGADGNRAIIRAEDSNSNGLAQITLDSNLVDMSEVNADLRLATGQAIGDGSGVKRISIDSGATRIYNSAGQAQGVFEDNSAIKFNTRSGEPFLISDREGNFDAVTYITSSSAPGTLELTNAKIDSPNRDIKIAGNTGVIIDDNNNGQRLAEFTASEILFNDPAPAGSDTLFSIPQGGPVSVDNTRLEIQGNNNCRFTGNNSTIRWGGGAGFYLDSNENIIGEDGSGNTATLI